MATATLADVHFKVDAQTKVRADEILEQLGLNMSNYMNMALKQLVYRRAIPFRATLEDARVINLDRASKQAALSALKEASNSIKNGEGLTLDETIASMEEIVDAKL